MYLIVFLYLQLYLLADSTCESNICFYDIDICGHQASSEKRSSMSAFETNRSRKAKTEALKRLCVRGDGYNSSKKSKKFRERQQNSDSVCNPGILVSSQIVSSSTDKETTQLVENNRLNSTDLEIPASKTTSFPELERQKAKTKLRKLFSYLLKDNKKKIFKKKRKPYVRIELNSKQKEIVNQNFSNACDEIKKYITDNILTQKDEILDPTDFEYFEKKEKEILNLRIPKTNRILFISTDGIYSIWKSKILEIFNNAPLFLYSILPEILSIKNLVKEDSKSIKPQGGNYLVTLLIFEAIVGNPSLNNEKINMKNQKIEGFTDLTMCSQSLRGISAYLRMLLEDIERMMEILKELKNTYLPAESDLSLLHSVEKESMEQLRRRNNSSA
ncbi:hypothetical protein CWI38_0233p0010 [Hamiltosporidium tvaerminnensis]|uniref:Uncharacterized protein n=1 Tax=Hamiltosporidium tvaerminnensis TaxID=1176355 RepID=A0A4Q9M1T5_9MICR|nr:hypothetical protein CWI38_0233p0010 [Hamiltosporidium tvaerminnensis]